jgi:hypothetical protein
VASIAAPVAMPTEPHHALRRPDVFLGAQGLVGPHELGLGLWWTQFFVGPAVPFVLGFTAAAAYSRINGSDAVGASAGVSLVLPLVRRFTIGATPAALRLGCDTSFKSCAPDVGATLGVLVIPLGDATWVGLEGPSWSWTSREVGNTWLGVSFGWSHERALEPQSPGAEAVASWHPPRPEEVSAYRETRSTRVVYLATTVVSQTDNQFVGLGLAWRLDRDGWNRRSGLAPGLQLEIDQGRIDGPESGGGVAVAPTLWAYLMPSRLALTATPALLRVGALAGSAVGADVAARAGVVLDLGRLELSVDSPPLSYVEQSRWHALPFTMRLGLMLD